ncbi:unnamed protein product [Durusdinium trenchii]|uniref:Uncharacterized protein n=1 Tax=Durusdinium trenchii TaxID=1381693 RepID=A0ABP0STG4_9DINO
MRQIFLGPSTAKESYKGLVGNTILLAQAEAKTTQILPSLNKVLDQLVIVFTRSVEEVKTCKALTVNRAEFVDCLRLRKKHCPVFFDTDIDQDAVQKLPVEGVPNEFIEHAIHLPESTFLQRMQGPGDLPVTAPPSNTDGNIAEESDDDHEVAQADDESVHDDAPACADEGHERATRESQKSPEFMIAIDYEQDPKPAQLFQAMQKKLEHLQKEVAKVKTNQSGAWENVSATVRQVGQQETCQRLVIDLQDTMRKLLKEAKNLDDVAASLLQTSVTADFFEKGGQIHIDALAVPTTTVLSSFDPRSFPSCFVEFYYGDAVPGLSGRPNSTVTYQSLFSALMQREEMEYSCSDDVEPYQARAVSRFDSPEFAALFGDILRKMKTLQAVNASFQRQGFEKDLKTIASSQTTDFLAAAAGEMCQSSIEDDFASSSVPGVAGFALAILEALEAQGRGFQHGHRLVRAIPGFLASMQIQDGDLSPKSLRAKMLQHNAKLISQVNTLQYEKSTLVGEQAGIKMKPEPFSALQQKQTKFDGGLEADEITQRLLLPVVAAERLKHVEREIAASEQQQRPPANFFKEVSLTGAELSTLPEYKLPCIIPQAAAWKGPLSFSVDCDESGVITKVACPDGEDACNFDTFLAEAHRLAAAANRSTWAAVAKLLRKEMLQSDATTSCPASENLTPEMAAQQLEELFDRNANRDEAQVTEIDVPLAWKGPAAYAKSLIDKFPFNQEQLDLLALLVNPLEVAWRNREDTSVYTLPVDLGVDLEFLPPKPCAEHLIFNRHCDQCVSYPGVIQALSKTQTWSYTLPDEKISLKIKRTAFPLWPEKACSLYTMQGTTASPGLVAHMTLPARSPADIKFLAVYVMLSRPRSFKNLLTLGLNDKIRNIIESGPPEELLETFATLFGSKADETREAAREAAEHLGWQAGG